jgi:hypothetical protein
MLDVLVPPTEEDLKIKEAIRTELTSVIDTVKADNNRCTAMKVDDNTFVIKNVVISMTGNTFIVVKDENKVCIETLLVNVNVSKIKNYILKLIKK